LSYLFDVDVNNDGVKDNFKVVITSYMFGGVSQVACLSGYLSNGVEGRTYNSHLICEANSLSGFGLNDVDFDGDLDLVFHSNYSN
jgi:hypothetical protein